MNGVSRPEPYSSSAVTGILLSSFDPEGSMVVAFANGEIRTWQANASQEVLKSVYGRKNIDIEDLQVFTFNVKD